MNGDIEKYNTLQTAEDQIICKLMDEISSNLPKAEGRIWHGNPVWFIDDNPIVGYSKHKSGMQLLFWSGASFEENLQPVGKYKAAEMRYTDAAQVNVEDLTRWLNKSVEIQWDYKNLVKRQGALERLK